MQFPRSAVFKNPCFKLKLIKTKRIEVSYTILRKSPQVLHNKSLKSMKNCTWICNLCDIWIKHLKQILLNQEN